MIFQGLKTGMYYLRTKPAASAIQFTVDKAKLKKMSSISSIKSEQEKKQEQQEANMAALACSLANKEACVMCSG